MTIATILIDLASIEVTTKEHLSTLENVIKRLKVEYDKLDKRSYMLKCLEAGGVDNWEWYGDSLQPYYRKYYPEDYEGEADDN